MAEGLSKTKILVVDDDHSVLELAKIELKAAGHDVELAAGGEEALKKIGKPHKQKIHFDIIFADFYMQGMDGIQLCEQVHALTPATDLVLFSAQLTLVTKDRLDSFYKNGGRLIIQKGSEKHLLTKTVQFLAELRKDRVSKEREHARLLDLDRKVREGRLREEK